MGHRKPWRIVSELTNEADRPDYTLFEGSKKLVFIGAKKFGSGENINKYIHYCNESGIRYSITIDSDS